MIGIETLRVNEILLFSTLQFYNEEEARKYTQR